LIFVYNNVWRVYILILRNVLLKMTSYSLQKKWHVTKNMQVLLLTWEPLL